MSTAGPNKVLALTGGVGGAKLCLGLADELAAGALHVLVNTGDDFDHLGLRICPDLDTLLYTLSGRSNKTLGWGLAGESWQTLDTLRDLGGETWFQLGDRDLATHLLRTGMLNEGAELSAVAARLAAQLGISAHIHPMSNDPVRTVVHSDEGELPFQHYFVRRQCEPAVTGFRFDGIETARPNADLLQLLASTELRAIILCPSNPFVSIDPILQLPGVWQAMRACSAPVLAVSPIVAGLAIKGPAAKMMKELGMPVSAPSVAQHYQSRYPGLVERFVIDQSDVTLAPAVTATGLAVAVSATIMHSRQDKRVLANSLLALVDG